jgi:predicted alpha/beta-fold hydrolase
MKYAAPWWLPGGQLQTIWSALGARRVRGTAPVFQRERWETPDADFVDVDWLRGGEGLSNQRPLLAVFHGLEGSSRSHYAQALAACAAERGWRFAMPHFRGCSGAINRAPRAYHSGDHVEMDFLLRRLRASHQGPILAVGVSLGGNALLRWAGEVGEGAHALVSAVAAVCAPIDLAAGGHAIGRGVNRQIYNRMFMRTLVPKALAKWEQHPGLFDRERLLAARDLFEFDNVFTAPVHGLRDTEDYWCRASAKPWLPAIRVRALVLNARNDPFVPVQSLPSVKEAHKSVTLWQPAQGGHVGFAAGAWPGHVQTMPHAVCNWLAAQADSWGAAEPAQWRHG